MSDNHYSTPITPHNPLEGPRSELTINLYDGTDDQISIIIVHKDRPEYLNILLQSICVCSTANNYEIIVVDNASGQDSQDFLSELESSGEIKVVRNPRNEYWSKAANRGAQAADRNSKYLIFMHCDVVVIHPAWIDLLVNASESQRSGLIGVEPMTWTMGDNKATFIQEYCMLMTRQCWEECGPWCEELPQVGGAFILTMNAIQKGFKPQQLNNQRLVHHYRVFNLNVSEYEKFAEQARVTIPKVMRNTTELR